MMSPGQIAKAVARFDAIDASDPERAHSLADDLLLYYADAQIADAYDRLVARAPWWAGA